MTNIILHLNQLRKLTKGSLVNEARLFLFINGEQQYKVKNITECRFPWGLGDSSEKRWTVYTC